MPITTRCTPHGIRQQRMTQNKTFYDEVLHFAKQFENEAPDRILLGANEIPPNMRKAVAIQIGCRESLERKNSFWHRQGCFVPSKLALEQCSSDATSAYKERFIRNDYTIADITGGLGVDFFSLCKHAKYGYYVEINSELADVASYNFAKLGLHNATIYNADQENVCVELVAHGIDLVYADPARREKNDKYKRVFALDACQPDITKVIDKVKALCEKTGKTIPQFLIKVSPMLDISNLVKELPIIDEIHIISVKEEVKELLLFIQNAEIISDVEITAVELSTDGSLKYDFSSIYADEQGLITDHAPSIQQYIYEPGASVMKSGLFKSFGLKYSLQALHPNSHLYTANDYKEGVPGRCHQVIEVIPFKSSILKRLKSDIPKARVACRNFIMNAEELRKKIGVREDENTTIFGTTDANGNRVLIHAKRYHRK